MYNPFDVDSVSEDADYSPTTDSTNSDLKAGKSKFKLKESPEKSKKSTLPNGLVAHSNKKTPRNVENVEMKFIHTKPEARYMNADSTSMGKPSDAESMAKDSL